MAEKKLTKEEWEKQNDLEKRTQKLNEKLMPILKELHLTLSAEPFIYQGMIVAKPTVLDADTFNEKNKLDQSAPQSKEEKKVEENPSVKKEEKGGLVEG